MSIDQFRGLPDEHGTPRVEPLILGIAQKVREIGFALLEGFQPERSATEVVDLIGEVDALGTQESVHELKPALAKSCPSNTYSGNYGLSAFPLHTDMAHWHVPPHFLVLRCVEGSTAVQTSLTDGLPIIKQVGETILSRSLVKPRRPVRGKRPLLRLYDRNEEGCRILRWDEKFIVPASPAGIFGMSQIRAVVATAPCEDVYLTGPGDTLIIDNWRMLHGRGSVPPDARNRTIARAYLRSIN